MGKKRISPIPEAITALSSWMLPTKKSPCCQGISRAISFSAKSLHRGAGIVQCSGKRAKDRQHEPKPGWFHDWSDIAIHRPSTGPKPFSWAIRILSISLAGSFRNSKTQVFPSIPRDCWRVCVGWTIWRFSTLMEPNQAEEGDRQTRLLRHFFKCPCLPLS